MENLKKLAKKAALVAQITAASVSPMGAIERTLYRNRPEDEKATNLENPELSAEKAKSIPFENLN